MCRRWTAAAANLAKDVQDPGDHPALLTLKGWIFLHHILLPSLVPKYLFATGSSIAMSFFYSKVAQNLILLTFFGMSFLLSVY